MDEAFVTSVLGKTQDQHERAMRWAAIVVLILLVFHLCMFSPFVKTDKRLKDVKARLDSLSRTAMTVEGLAGSLEALSSSAIEAVARELNG